MEKAGFEYERDIVHAGLPHVLYGAGVLWRIGGGRVWAVVGDRRERLAPGGWVGRVPWGTTGHAQHGIRRRQAEPWRVAHDYRAQLDRPKLAAVRCRRRAAPPASARPRSSAEDRSLAPGA